MNVVFGIVVLAAALWLLRYFLKLLVGAAGFDAGQWFEGWDVERHIERARRADRLFSEGHADQALELLRSAFYLRPVATVALASKVGNHHSSVLSRLLAITSEYQGGTVRLLSLAKVDRLLSERRGLQSTLATARQSANAVRMRELDGLLTANSGELEAALQQLIAEVQAIGRNRVTH